MPPALLILDLDETLVYATREPLDREPDFSCEPYAVYRRPYLDRFLESVRRSYRLAIWTSSSEPYMECVLEAILPKDIGLEFAWSRDRSVRGSFTVGDRTYVYCEFEVPKAPGIDVLTTTELRQNYGISTLKITQNGREIWAPALDSRSRPATWCMGDTASASLSCF